MVKRNCFCFHYPLRTAHYPLLLITASYVQYYWSDFMSLRGVILAGGKGTRLGELTKVTNKHLLPVGPYPMVYHPLYKLTGAGMGDVLLVSGTEHMGDFVELLGSGKDYGVRLTYRVQDEAGGIAQALGLAELFCTDSRSCVLLGDNI